MSEKRIGDWMHKFNDINYSQTIITGLGTGRFGPVDTVLTPIWRAGFLGSPNAVRLVRMQLGLHKILTVDLLPSILSD